MTEKQTDIRLGFADLMEGVCCSEGVSPNAGRILGFIMMSDEPVPFSDLAERLSISRGSVSENTNLLIAHGVIERLRLEGDRRDHFIMRCDREGAIFERSRERTLKTLGALEDFGARADIGAHQKERISAIEEFLRARIAFEQAFFSTKIQQAGPRQK